ncbi:MAG: cupredoxin domain-containing protein [Armatimonadetes bacterium]|nr:cupredoxin domain-containing protein [Armatimonadota bacterium]
MALGVFILAGCEYPGVPRNVEGELPAWFAGEGPRAAPGAPASSPPPPGGPPPAQALPVQTGPVEIAFVEYELKPSRLAVRPGTITFILKNEGRFTHDFQVQGSGVDVKTPKFAPETTLRTQVTLKPGEYRISCPLSNHAERGMVGTLIVRGP